MSSQGLIKTAHPALQLHCCHLCWSAWNTYESKLMRRYLLHTIGRSTGKTHTQTQIQYSLVLQYCFDIPNKPITYLKSGSLFQKLKWLLRDTDCIKSLSMCYAGKSFWSPFFVELLEAATCWCVFYNIKSQSSTVKWVWNFDYSPPLQWQKYSGKGAEWKQLERCWKTATVVYL